MIHIQELNHIQKDYFSKLMWAMFGIQQENEVLGMLDNEALKKGLWKPCLYKLEKRLIDKFKSEFNGSIATLLREHYTKGACAYGEYFIGASVAFVCEWLYLQAYYPSLETYKGTIDIFEVNPLIRK